jgi:hypothetical protein
MAKSKTDPIFDPSRKREPYKTAGCLIPPPLEGGGWGKGDERLYSSPLQFVELLNILPELIKIGFSNYLKYAII